DTLVVFENYPVDQEIEKIIAGSELSVTDITNEEQTNYALTLMVLPESTGLHGKLSFELGYRAERYEEGTVTRILEQLELILTGLLDHSRKTVSELSILTAEEEHRLLIDWNDTASDYPQDKCIHQLFTEQVAIHPDKVAVVYQDETLSYRQLYDKSHELALYLQSLGVKPDSLVGLCVERSPEMMVGILGILQAGGAYVPLDPDYPDERLTYMLKNSQVNIVLSQEKFKERFSTLAPKNTELVTLDQPWLEIQDCVENIKTKKVTLHYDVNPDHLAYVIYTSGTTGKPKGVMVEHKALVNRIYWMQQQYSLNTDDIVLQKTPFSFDVSVWEFVWPMISGASVVFAKPEGHKDAQYLEDLINKEKVTTLHFVPSMLNVYLNHAKTSCSSIKQIFCSGEALDSKSVNDYKTKFPQALLLNLYGPTEAAIDVTAYDCSQLDSALVPIGAPIANTQIYILDKENNPVPIGVPGELHIAGDGLARGYLNRPELTEEKFIPNPFNPGTRMYKSGDLARWLVDGNIEYLGRIDTQVKIRGYRIELGEIEAQLNQNSEIKDSVVIAQKQEGNKQLVAYYVAKGSKQEQVVNLTNEDLRTHLQQTLPEYMLPAAFVSLEAIPLTPNGKVDRRALERMDVSLESSQTYLAPRNATEKLLVAIWADVLNLEPENIGVNDNFFELGGDSIKTIQIASKAIEHHIHFDVRDMFKYQSIHELLSHCDTTKVRVILKEEGTLQGAVDLSPIQSYFFKSTQTDIHYFNQSVLLNLNVHLSIDVLQDLIIPLLEQHDALRLRYVKDGNDWQQGYLGSVANTPDALGIHSYDIAALEEKEIPDYIEQTCNHWQARLDLEKGPIVRWVYFDSKSNGSDRLAIIVHHLVIDGVSWRILLEDLNQLIGQQFAQQQLQLSQKRSSYRNWVDSLAAYKESKQGQKELTFWIDQSKKNQHVSNAFVAKAYRNQDIQHKSVLLSKPNTEKLLKHCHQAYGTDINDLLLTAVMLSYHQATGDKTLMLDLEGHGREQIDPAIDITKTVGWFTSLYPVSFELSNPEDIGQSIKEVKTALHEIPNKGVGFSIFRYIDKHEAINAIPDAQVVFNFLGDFQLNERESVNNYFTFGGDSTGDSSSRQKEVNHLVAINGLVVFEQLSFTFSYPEEWQGQKVSHWQTYFISALETLIEHCDDSPRIGYTPSDFPLLPASLEQLDEMLPNLKQQRNIELNNVQDIYPLTPLQSGILFETLYAQTEENKGMYLTQSAIGVSGQADIEVMQQAWQLILNHYDALRMVAVTANVAKIKMDLQVILKQVDSKIEWVGWPEKNDAELKSACEQWMQKSKRSGINLDQAPLMRMSLFQGQESCYLLFEQHHMMMDGWSLNIVLSNLFKLYQALLQQQDYQLPPSAPHK
ncbi:MAG: amino acid adenylation domain-containing protein, partial [Arenicella sp.]|nr:amino acid adenylation domain-containing protein [Arenicella sp.]